MLDVKDKIEEAVKAIRHHTDLVPKLGITLGSGLSGVLSTTADQTAIPYSSIPNIPESTVAGHQGSLVFTHIGETPVVIMQGRTHYYEGYLLPTITLPVRIFKALGCKTLIATNAAGGLNPDFAVGDLMMITDHINLMGVNPLIGENDDSLGPRFPDMRGAYSPELQDSAAAAAESLDISLRRGVYIGVSGPNFETPAELRFMRMIGGDAVGMSTVPEVIVAKHAGLAVLGFSVITDMALPEKTEAIDHADVLRVAESAGPRLAELLIRIVNAK